MNSLLDWMQHSAVQRIGWTLLHFLWQGTAIAWLAAIGLALLRRRSAAARYTLCCIAMAAMAIAPVATCLLIKPPLIRAVANAPQPPPPMRAQSGGTPADMPLLPREEITPGGTRMKPPAPPLADGRPPAPPVSSSRLERALHHVSPLLPWMVVIWMMGALVLSVRLTGGWMMTQRLRRRGEPAAQEILERFETLIDRAKIYRPVRLLISSLAGTPAMVGWLRPVILLPASVLTGLTPQQLDAILAHELAHIRRHDYLVNLLQCMLETLLFYHPAVWWISARMRREREMACDDLSVQWAGPRITLAKALTAVEELRGPAIPLALAAGDGLLMQRVQRLLGQSPRRGGGAVWPLLVVAVLITSMFLGVRSALRAANPPAPPPPAAPASAPSTRPAKLDPTALVHERNRLLTEGDKKFRAGVLALAEQFPQLRKAAVGSAERPSLKEALEGTSDAGMISVQVNWPPRTKAGPTIEIPEAQQYDITFQLYERPVDPVAAADITSFYPRLKLVGRVGMQIGDVKLAEAVGKLMDQALAPLAALDKAQDEADAASWSVPARGLSIKVEPAKAEFTVGEPIELIWTFKNVTNRPMKILNVAPEFADYFHQYSFTDTTDKAIATTPPEHSFDNVREILEVLPGGATIEHRVTLNSWKLAGLGHPYTPIGDEPRVFYIHPHYTTRAGNDIKEPGAWLGEIEGSRAMVRILPKQHPLAKLSGDVANDEKSIAEAKAIGEKQAAEDIAAGKAVILYYGKPWAARKPLVDDATGLPVEILAGCAVTPRFVAGVDAYNAAVRNAKVKHPPQKPADAPKAPDDVEMPVMTAWGKVEEIDHPLLKGIKEVSFTAAHDKQGLVQMSARFTPNATWKPKDAGPTAEDPAKPYVWIQVSLWRKDVPSQPPPAARQYKYDANYTYLVVVKSSDADLQKKIEAILTQ